MSNRSTLIKDLKSSASSSNSDNQLNTSDDDFAVQEVLSEIENEKQKQNISNQAINNGMMHNNNILQPPTMLQQSHPSMFQNDTIHNQLLQQQMLQQQLLQQQLLQQQNNEKYERVYDGITHKVKDICMKYNKLFVLSVVLFLVFTNMNILGLLKIENMSIFESYPILINITTAFIFGLTVVFVNQLM